MNICCAFSALISTTPANTVHTHPSPRVPVFRGSWSSLSSWIVSDWFKSIEHLNPWPTAIGESQNCVLECRDRNVFSPCRRDWESPSPWLRLVAILPPEWASQAMSSLSCGQMREKGNGSLTTPSNQWTSEPEIWLTSGILAYMWQQNPFIVKSVWVLFFAMRHSKPASFDPVISLLGIYPNEIIIDSYKKNPLSTSLFIREKNRNSMHKYLQMGEG